MDDKNRDEIGINYLSVRRRRRRDHHRFNFVASLNVIGLGDECSPRVLIELRAKPERRRITSRKQRQRGGWKVCA